MAELDALVAASRVPWWALLRCLEHSATLGHAFVQNLRRGHYELGVEVPAERRLAEAFAELALVI